MNLKEAGILFYQETEYNYPQEIQDKMVNILLKIGDLPDWAFRLSCTMPASGFEPCAIGWIDGLDEILLSVKYSTYIKSRAGQCGYIPLKVYNSIIRNLLDAIDITKNAFEITQVERDQQEALKALLDLFEKRQISHDEFERHYTENEDVFARVFGSDNTREIVATGIDCSCGFIVQDTIRLLIYHILGKEVDLDKTRYNCLASFNVSSDELAERLGAIYGIMSGLKCFLEDAPMTKNTDIMGYAKRAYNCFKESEVDGKIKQFLAIHFFSSLKIFHEKLIKRFSDSIPKAFIEPITLDD